MESTRSESVRRYTLPQTYLLRSSSVERSKTPGMHNLGFLPVLLRAQKQAAALYSIHPSLIEFDPE
jgi:hypothetical protein